MNTSAFAPEVAEKIRNVVIFEGLELEELGIELEEIELDTMLFEETGLDLDSVDALEVLAGVQREFGVTFPEIDSDFIASNASTVRQLATTVSLHLEASAAA
ncbi:acyl carrier protein [Pelagimonas phthalicica]|uniref:Acyl carrier protein n=1 Tax=Pelagimonas phthalicica TaxID=1037362 RepID=A0A238J5K4_9RHOB|nr:phosphopantetheine-binding protein [Pelagimonas phthalicica]TDS95446.1 acyl carrier protein [Pelagimonas phthalicica]SMX26031.1 acyl carrier protein [Pelagimonas phthalicica]